MSEEAIDSRQKDGEQILVMTVGGTPNPLITSIRDSRPDAVIFIASNGSSSQIQEILQASGGVKRSENIIISDHDDLELCLREIREEMPKKLKILGKSQNEFLLANITGGTKAMVAALTLAMLEFNSGFTYIGGTNRTKNQLGHVTDGDEKILYTPNPWDTLGLREARVLAQAFNAGQFVAARENAEYLKTRDSDYSIFYDGLAHVIKGFDSWDVFDYKSAKNEFTQGMNKLRYYDNRNHEAFRSLYLSFQKCLTALLQTADDAMILLGKFRKLDQDQGKAYLADLVGNARRCAARGHYDDAVARLYSAVEKAFKIALARLGIDNSHVPLNLLQEKCPAIAEKYRQQPERILPGGRVKTSAEPEAALPLGESYILLQSIAPEDPLTRAYAEHKAELDDALETRNSSLLAHGYKPVSAENYNKLLALTLDFLGFTEAELLNFPQIEYKNILF